MTRLLVVALVSCLMITTISPAKAENRVVGYIKSGQSAAEVAKLGDTAFTPIYEGQHLGFLKGPIWVKLHLDAIPPPSQMFLSIRPIHLDQIAIYDARSPHEPLFVGGDTVESPLALQRNAYTLKLSDDYFGGSLLIRLETRNVMQPSFNIYSTAEILRIEKILGLIFSIAFSATLFYLLWATIALFLTPSWLLASYILRLTFYLLVLFVHSGTFRFLMAPDGIPPQDLVHNFSALGYITVAQVFDYMLLLELRGRRGPRLFLAIVGIFALIKLLAVSIGELGFALQMNNLSAIVTLFIGILAALAAKRRLSEAHTISCTLIVFYFLLQALPLAVLILAAELQSPHYSMLMDVAFLNYSIVPGAYVTYLLFQRHKAIIRERHIIEEQKNALQAVARLESEKRAEIGNLLKMLTHEVKTPLAMLQMSQTIGELNEALVAKAVATIRHILHQCDRVDDIETGNFTITLTPVNIHHAVLKASQDTGVAVDIASCATPQGFADFNLLQIVLQNLLYNAEKYRLPDTAIKAEITLHEDTIALRLVNINGSKTLPDPYRMFEKYYRHSGASSQPGTGLGLYIVSQLCERMSVMVNAEVEGTQIIFVLRFPCAPTPM